MQNLQSCKLSLDRSLEKSSEIAILMRKTSGNWTG
jgi:hypothetical protein